MTPKELISFMSANDNICVELYQIFESNIFKDIDIQQIKGLIPLWMAQAGISPESSMEKIFFEKLVNANNNEITHKILYSFDCETLVATLQDRISSIDDLLTELYDNISHSANYPTDEYERGVRHMNGAASKCFTFANAIFISLASTLDILTKISIELYHIHFDKIDFKKYPSFISNNKIFGKPYKELSSINSNTISQDSALIRKVISIRDEIIHNGTWDYRPAIYGGWKEEVYDEWIMMPDFNASGAFISSKNRNRNNRLERTN
jgi:hypothetical protein